MWVTESEKVNAKQYDLLSYLRYADPGELVKSARGEYCTRMHDSLKISNGLWYWYSQQIGGRSAVDYLIKVKGYSLPEAVKEVNRAMMGKSPSFFIPEKKKKEFTLPKKNGNNNRAIEYLKSRGIEENLIKDLIEKGIIFESKAHKSVVFLGLDEGGQPRHASYRATEGSRHLLGICIFSASTHTLSIMKKTREYGASSTLRLSRASKIFPMKKRVKSTLWIENITVRISMMLLRAEISLSGRCMYRS